VAGYVWVALSELGRRNAKEQNRKIRKGGNYSDVLPLKAARRDNISNLMPFHLWGTTLVAHGVRWTGTKRNSEGG